MKLKKNSNKIFQTNETKIIFLDQYFPQVSQDCSVSCWWWFLMLHVVFSPWIWMTFCRESTAFSQGFWSNTDWDRGSTCGTCGQRLERETCCRYLWKDTCSVCAKTHPTSMPSKALTQASEASQIALRSCPPSRAMTTLPPASDISWRVRKPKPGGEQSMHKTEYTKVKPEIDCMGLYQCCGKLALCTPDSDKLLRIISQHHVDWWHHFLFCKGLKPKKWSLCWSTENCSSTNVHLRLPAKRVNLHRLSY